MDYRIDMVACVLVAIFAVITVTVPVGAVSDTEVNPCAYFADDYPKYQGPILDPNDLRKEQHKAQDQVRLETSEVTKVLLEQSNVDAQLLLEYVSLNQRNILARHHEAVEALRQRYRIEIDGLEKQFRNDDKKLREEIQRAHDDAFLEYLALGIQVTGSLAIELMSGTQGETSDDTSEAATTQGTTSITTSITVVNPIIHCEDKECVMQLRHFDPAFTDQPLEPGKSLPDSTQDRDLDGSLSEGLEIFESLSNTLHSLSPPVQQGRDGRFQPSAAEKQVISTAVDFWGPTAFSKGVVEVFSGHDPVTGEEVSRLVSGAGILLTPLPGGKFAIKKIPGRHFRKILKNLPELSKYLGRRAKLVGRGLEMRSPQAIRFSQDSIKPFFKDGRSIDDLVAGLRSGHINPKDVPAIRLVERDGTFFTLDNRRLEAFRRAEVEVPTRMATPQEMADEAWKFTTKNGGKSVWIRDEISRTRKD